MEPTKLRAVPNPLEGASLDDVKGLITHAVIPRVEAASNAAEANRVELARLTEQVHNMRREQGFMQAALREQGKAFAQLSAQVQTLSINVGGLTAAAGDLQETITRHMGRLEREIRAVDQKAERASDTNEIVEDLARVVVVDKRDSARARARWRDLIHGVVQRVAIPVAAALGLALAMKVNGCW